MSYGASYCFLINCASNAFRAEALFKQNEANIKSQFDEVEFVYIRKQDSISQIAREKAERHTHIFACGGDGTVNQVVNGLIGTNGIMGVIPLGSGNDFAQSLNLDGTLEQSLRVLKSNTIKQVDVIETEAGYFINTLGIGVDGATNYHASNSRFKSGFLKYFTGGLQALWKSELFEYRLIINGEEVQASPKTWMITLANGKREGGRYTISPDSNHADGVLEILIVQPVSKVRLIYEFLKLSLGFSFKENVIRVFTTDNSIFVEVESPQKVHADGEQLSAFRKGKFKLLAGKIGVVTG